MFFSFTLPFSVVSETMSMIGMYKDNVTIQVDDKELSEIKRISEQFNLPVFYGCNDTDKNNIYNMQILWHGIGSHALLKFPLNERNEEEKERRTITVKNETLSVSHSTFVKGCLTYTIDELPAFTAKENEVKTEMQSQISEKLTIFKSNWRDNYNINKVTITGFSDKRDIKNKLGNNYDISKKRAENAKTILSDYLCKLNKSQELCSIIEKVEIKGNGRKNTTEKCEYLPAKQLRLKKYQSEVDECFAPDRKVEFQFELTPKK